MAVQYLADVWPQDDKTHILLCLEDPQGEMTWPYKGKANNKDGLRFLERYGATPIKSAISTGIFQYVYLDKKRAEQAIPWHIDYGKQLSLLTT